MSSVQTTLTANTLDLIPITGDDTSVQHFNVEIRDLSSEFESGWTNGNCRVIKIGKLVHIEMNGTYNSGFNASVKVIKIPTDLYPKRTVRFIFYAGSHLLGVLYSSSGYFNAQSAISNQGTMTLLHITATYECV